MYFLLLLVVLSGCLMEDPVYPFELVVDSEYPELMEPALAGVEAWQKALPDYAKNSVATAVRLGSNPESCNAVFVTYDDLTGAKAGEHRMHRARKECSWTIRIDVDASDPLTTMTHELGHALGVEHSSNPFSVMYKNLTTSAQIIFHDDMVQAVKTLDFWGALDYSAIPSD